MAIIGQAGYKVLRPMDYFSGKDYNKDDEIYGCTADDKQGDKVILQLGTSQNSLQNYQITKIGIQAKPKTLIGLYINKDPDDKITPTQFMVGASGIFELDLGSYNDTWISNTIIIYNAITLIKDNTEEPDSTTLKNLVSRLQSNLSKILDCSESGKEILIDKDYDGEVDDSIKVDNIWDAIYDTTLDFQEVYGEQYLYYKREQYGKYELGSEKPSNIIIDYIAEEKKGGE